MHCIIKTHRHKSLDDGVAPSVYVSITVMDFMHETYHWSAKNPAPMLHEH